jgi:RNA polymerase sigma factor (sigma-70 family)
LLLFSQKSNQKRANGPTKAITQAIRARPFDPSRTISASAWTSNFGISAKIGRANGPNYQSDKGRLFTWMISICRNQSIDMVRSKAYKVQQSSAGAEAMEAGGAADSSYRFNPDQIGIREKLEKLPREYQEVIEIVYYKGYTHKEAAEALQMPLGTVKSRIRIAIRELRNIFGES